jgi:hypothetical protein
MSGFKISRENMPRDGQYAKSLGNNASCGFFHGCFMQFYKLLPGLLAVLYWGLLHKIHCSSWQPADFIHVRGQFDESPYER